MRNPSVIPTLVATMACVAVFSAASSLEKTLPPDDKHDPRPIATSRLPGSTPENVQITTQDAGLIGKIAFASDRDGNLEVYSMDADGGGQTRVTENPAEDYSPAWSPDGTRLAFVSTRDGNAEIYVTNMDGTAQTRLTNNSASDLGPKWSPDGSQILFFTNRDGNDEIYSMNADGSNPVNLTKHPADDTSFSFSPSGAMIAFSSNRDDTQFDIYTMEATGASLTRLTTAPGDDIDPSWSSQRIIFLSNRDDTDEIYSMTPAGLNQTRLTNNADFDVDPAQPTDGSKISFATNRDGNLEIYLMNADGSGLLRLTTNETSDLQPAPQPQAVIPPPSGSTTVQFSAANYLVSEGGSFATLTVTRSGDIAGTTRVDFATVSGSATHRSDYTEHYGTLTFNPGETSKGFIILITDDVFTESDETVRATLSNPTVSTLGSLNTATLTIADNDTAQVRPNPIDDARFFVTQHYADFLNRAPDSVGLEDRIAQINVCGNNVSCLEEKRILVSSDFIRSSEFQDRGYFIYRFYLVAFGRPPTYAEFIADMSRLSGILTPAQLEAAKVAFINDFMSRPAFVSKHNSLNNTEYVDHLLTQSVSGGNVNALVLKISAAQNQQSSSVQLMLDQSGPAPDQLAALDSVLFLRDPFPVVNFSNIFTLGMDRNTRVTIFALNLQLAPGETSSAVVVNLIASNNQSYDIAAQDVRPVPNLPLTQVTFRLPDDLPTGMVTVRIRVHGQTSNAGTFRTVGVSLPSRQSLIDALNAGTKTRAQVLREIVESGEVTQRYFNQAFVALAYFGYLRHDPDSMYLERVRILETTGDFRIIVDGFINSPEYRSRFGPE